MAQPADNTRESTSTAARVRIDADALARLGRPGANPAKRQTQPCKQSGDKLSPTNSQAGARPTSRESRDAIERAENEGMVP